MICWWCGKPAPAGVCPGPHPDYRLKKHGGNVTDVPGDRRGRCIVTGDFEAKLTQVRDSGVEGTRTASGRLRRKQGQRCRVCNRVRVLTDGECTECWWFGVVRRGQENSPVEGWRGVSTFSEGEMASWTAAHG